MEAYDIMQAINGILLLACMALAGGLYKNIKEAQKDSKDDIKNLYKSLYRQQEQLSDVLSLTKVNQEIMRAHIEQRGIHQDLADEVHKLKK